jgi:flagellar biosynthesis regulator FlbT
LVDAHRTLAEKLRWPAPPANVDAWRSQWGGAFILRHREVITTTTELVEELARLADATRKRARTILARESERGPLRRLYAAFKAALIHDLTEDDFADVIAQTISYGLLIARFSRAAISAQNLVDMVPATNPFLRELLQTFLALAGQQKAFDFDELGIQDVVEVLNRANADAVKADFGNRTRGEDPVIHFYEHFLAAYDRQKKIQRGVFYTPQPVVSYIVRSVHELLQKEFDIEDGLASTVTWADMLKRNPGLNLPKIRVPKAGKAEGEEVDLSPHEFFVMILDIATGTGTFLDETVEVIFQHLQAKWAKHGLQGMPIIRHTALRIPSFKDYWNAYVPAALLPRLYGYELMMAPYTIAHMKLALKFSEINARLGQTDYLFKFDGRANIFLTNTLEPPSGFQTQQFADFFPALAHESKG